MNKISTALVRTYKNWQATRTRNKLLVTALAMTLVVGAAGWFALQGQDSNTATNAHSQKTQATNQVNKEAITSPTTDPAQNKQTEAAQQQQQQAQQQQAAQAAKAAMWLPTADRPLNFHWVLGEALNVNNPVQMGLRDLNGKPLPEPDVYDIDGEYNTKETVDYLHSKGKKVICYFDAGVYETYRSDAAKFKAIKPKIWGNKDEGWDGSYWLDIRRVEELKPIMKSRIQMCKDKGFDSIEPDEITNWSNDPGFPITYQHQITYNRALASWAHEAGISIGLKGNLEQAHDLVNDFDWTLNEECFQYNECTTINNSGGPGADGKDYPGLQLFVQQNKAVWIAEYKRFDKNNPAKWSRICTTSKKQKFNTYIFKLGLPNNGGRLPCATTSPTQW